MLNSENKKLEKASRIALIGSVALAVITVVFGIIAIMQVSTQFEAIYKEHLLQMKAQNIEPMPKETLKAAVEIGVYITLFISVAISALYIFLSWRLKKAKGKAIAITLIVLSSISIFFALFSIVTNPTQIISTLIGLIGYGTVITGAVIGLTASQEEYEFNRLG